MKQTYINLDEAYQALNENIDKISKSMKHELSSICDLRNNDDFYIFADLLRNHKNNDGWGVYSDLSSNNFYMSLSNPQKNLKPSIFSTLLQNCKFHEFTPNEITSIN
jgi:hypothetical protein